MHTNDFIGLGVIALLIIGVLVLLSRISKPYDVKTEEEFEKRRKESAGMMVAGLEGLQGILDPAEKRAKCSRICVAVFTTTRKRRTIRLKRVRRHASGTVARPLGRAQQNDIRFDGGLVRRMNGRTSAPSKRLCRGERSYA